VKKNIVEVVFRSEIEHQNLKEYIDTLTKVYDAIREEIRETAFINFSAYDYHDCSGVETYVEIFRPESDGEEHQRELVELRAKLQEENREKELFKRLKKKYENN
jgi:hypothetical protein